jgi:predicted metal-dependent phosphoesterase TrpH
VIDLHMHSVCSDGTDSPGDLAEKVVAAGLSAAALTDHDTTMGHEAYGAVLAQHGIAFIPGVEISCRHQGTGASTHVLCYFVEADPQSPLQQILAGLRHDRSTRNLRLLERLHELGYDTITAEQIEALASKPLVDAGRPHFAQAIQANYPDEFASVNEVFAKLLGNDQPGYIPKAHLSIADAAHAASASGAVAVIAHPLITFCNDSATNWTVDAQRAHLIPLFEEFKRDGVVGIETHYSRHSPEETQMLLDLCQVFDFVPTGGSDFHGFNKKDLAVGIGVIEKKGTAGELRVPDSTIDALKARR